MKTRSPGKLHRLAASSLVALILLLEPHSSVKADTPFDPDLLEVSTSGDTVNLRGMYSVSDVPVQAIPLPDSTSAVQGPVFVVGDGIEVDVSSADEWNRALEECLAHGASGPILLQQCRIILGLEHPESGETPDSDPATSTAPSVESLSPRQIISYAHAQHTINGAGLAWQPKTKRPRRTAHPRARHLTHTKRHPEPLWPINLHRFGSLTLLLRLWRWLPHLGNHGPFRSVSCSDPQPRLHPNFTRAHHHPDNNMECDHHLPFWAQRLPRQRPNQHRNLHPHHNP